MNSASTNGGGSTSFDDTNASSFPVGQSMDYSSQVGSESYYSRTDGAESSVTGHGTSSQYDHDATEVVHEMHLALLYLLSNPDEFKNAMRAHPPQGATTLDQWNVEIEEDDEESVVTSGAAASTPLPFIVFADDAEVVLPQAHTASQLFGIEKVEGIELEAAAGIPALSQLFLRWLGKSRLVLESIGLTMSVCSVSCLFWNCKEVGRSRSNIRCLDTDLYVSLDAALMPGGDHLNIIDPPGLTVMRIAGGRYRVTAAHRVVWTWMNEFASLSFDGRIGEEVASESPPLQIGDLVSLTIVDVFETDNQGKLLSYCPTFDNRAVRKTNQTTETLRKSSTKLFTMLGRAQKAVAKSEVNKKATEQLNKMGIMQHAKNVAENVKHRVDEAVQSMHSPGKVSQKRNQEKEEVTDYKEFEKAITAAEEAATGDSIPPILSSATSTSRAELYVSEVSTDDSTELTT